MTGPGVSIVAVGFNPATLATRGKWGFVYKAVGADGDLHGPASWDECAEWCSLRGVELEDDQCPLCGMDAVRGEPHGKCSIVAERMARWGM